MKLYFLRHTEAEDGRNDELRELTKKGRHDAARIGKFLRQADIRFDAAYASPLVRARQTAEVVLENCECLEEGDLQITAILRNETTADEFFRWLGRLSPANNVLLVGHAPTIGERVSEMMHLPEAHFLDFPKGGLACVNTDNRRSANLKFFITPKLL